MVRSAAEGLGAFANPVIYADESTRAVFLQRVATYTCGGLTLASLSALTSAYMLANGPAVLWNQWVQMGVIFGMFFVAQNVAAGMVYNNTSKLAGFTLGMTAQGIAMGYLLVVAVAMGSSSYGTGGLEQFTIVFQAIGLTMVTVLSMVGYLWTNPKDLSMIRGAMTVMAVPMLILMVMSFVFPIGGTLGLILCGAFVAMSAAGLMYQLNQVMHSMPAHMHIESSYQIALGILVLFWNLLSLLMRLQSRD
jgi:FtsH-binding integral membrane protein